MFVESDLKITTTFF